jgi:hypothetical protein
MTPAGSALTPSYYLYRELTMDKASQVLTKALPEGVLHTFTARSSCLILILIAF